MQLEQTYRELTAIGASIGAGCVPCIEYHVPAGRKAGLSETELAEAVGAAEVVRGAAAGLLRARTRGLLTSDDALPVAAACSEETSPARELVLLGASVGANSHPLLEMHVQAALDAGLTAAEVRDAVKMALYVQRHAAELTERKAVALFEPLGLTLHSDSA